jgi:hypothetical protein
MNSTDLHRITRLEVIDETGRVYTNWHPDNRITLSFQDGNRTLKVFVGKDSQATRSTMEAEGDANP